MPAPAPHVIVVGAGVFGAACALELRARGWSVTLIDRGPLPHAAAASTDVSKVVRMDYGADVFYHQLAEVALEGWDRWNVDWPRPLYHQTGFLVLSPGAMRPGGFEYESYQVLSARGHAPIRLGDLGAAERPTRFDLSSYSDGYLNPRGGWAESGEVVGRLVTLGAEAGVVHRPGGFRELASVGSRISGIWLVDGATISADVVVVAAGAWTPILLPWMTDVIWPTAHPVLHFQVEDPGAFMAPDLPTWAAGIAESGWYGFPALSDGRVKVAHHGAGSPRTPDDRGEVGVAHEDRTRGFLTRAIPELAGTPVVHRRVCMYCDTFDGDLWIDRDPEREGLVVATGGSGHAFKFAPMLGGLIADVVEGKENRWASRFAWRARGEVRVEPARYEGT